MDILFGGSKILLRPDPHNMSTKRKMCVKAAPKARIRKTSCLLMRVTYLPTNSRSLCEYISVKTTVINEQHNFLFHQKYFILKTLFSQA